MYVVCAYCRCPGCGEASSPMSLLFDEDYDSHSFYDFEKAEDWFKEADAVVFVGTSFAVTLTCASQKCACLCHIAHHHRAAFCFPLVCVLHFFHRRNASKMSINRCSRCLD